MALYKVTKTQAMATLRCGHDVTFPLTDLRVWKNQVRFPACPVCGKSRVTAFCVIPEEGTPPERMVGDVAIHTLHKRVHDLGQFADGAKPEEVLAAMHPLASEVGELDILPGRLVSVGKEE